MPTENTILLSNVTAEAGNADFSYGSKKKASGYHQSGDAVHTAIYTVNSFSGTIKLQGTLNLYPGDNDWVDIVNTQIGDDSSSVGGVHGQNYSISRNFVGNFVWVRAAYNLQDGTIVDLRFNY
jgi:hypothetical protein